MTGRAARIIPVLRHRETQSKLALASLTRAIALGRTRLQELEHVAGSLSERLTECRDARFAGRAPTIAALTALEDQMRTLRAARDHLAGLNRQAEQALGELHARQRLAAREWRRNGARLEHVDSLVRRERQLLALRVSERDDDA
jgi:hypothetical protein